MRLMKNADLYSRQIRNVTSLETSNIAMVVSSNIVFSTYYSLNADLSTAIHGFNNVYDYIGKDSSVVYDKIKEFPMAGVESLVMNTEYDDDLGFDVNFTSDGMIFPNTIVPKPGDVFLFPQSIKTAIFIVTNVTRAVVRSNPFTEITFKLLSQNDEDRVFLEKQVKETYRVTVSSIGTDKSLLVKESSYFALEDHVKQYIEIANFYTSTFYDRFKACFTYSNIYDSNKDCPVTIIDFMLWKFLYSRGIVVYDPVINYALNNYKISFDKVFIERPMLIDDHAYNISIFERLISKNRKSPFFEYRYPVAYTESSQLTKYQGANLLYIENYSKQKNCNSLIGNFTIFDDEFIDRILHCKPYSEDAIEVNSTMRNAVINHFNDKAIDFENIYIDENKSIENYYLVPMILELYKNKIESMQI